MHPHWLATDEGTPVPVRAKTPVAAPNVAQVSTVSRRPAAILGVLLTLGIGAVVYGLFDTELFSISGQVTPMGETIFDEEIEETAEGQTNEEAPLIAFNESEEASPEIALTSDKPQGTVVRRTAQGVPSDRLSSTIPVNPNAEGTGTPLPENSQGVTSDVIERMHSGAPEPPYQPTTGSGMVLATLTGALTLLMLLSRRLLRA